MDLNSHLFDFIFDLTGKCFSWKFIFTTFPKDFLQFIYQVIQRVVRAGQPGIQPHKEEACKNLR